MMKRTFLTRLFLGTFLFLVALTVFGCGYYVTVEGGDTLNSIARKYDVTVNDILDTNPGIKDPDLLFVGQKVRIPREKSLTAMKDESANASPGQSKKAAASKPKADTRKKSSPTPDKKDMTERNKTAPAVPPETNKQTQMKFVWPVAGSILRYYGKGSDGIINEGIDISSTVGHKIVAAAEGVVIFSDDSLKGYGNMIVIQHENKYVTVYAHNRVNLVSKGDKVSQGQVIAEVGDTGRANVPHLHFEIRKGTSCQDPMQYLPKN